MNDIIYGLLKFYELSDEEVYQMMEYYGPYYMENPFLIEMADTAVGRISDKKHKALAHQFITDFRR